MQACKEQDYSLELSLCSISQELFMLWGKKVRHTRSRSMLGPPLCYPNILISRLWTHSRFAFFGEIPLEFLLCHCVMQRDICFGYLLGDRKMVLKPLMLMRESNLGLPLPGWVWTPVFKSKGVQSFASSSVRHVSEENSNYHCTLGRACLGRCVLSII